MRAVIIEGDGTASRLRVVEADRPDPGPGQILVRVHAAGVNRADLARAKVHFGSDSAPRFAIAGMEMAGEVVAVGEGSTRFAIGDRVMAMAPRSYAEYAVVHESIASPIPDSLDWHSAAAICLSFITAHDALITNAALVEGETVLVQGAAASAGIAAVQIAALRKAGRIFGTSRNPDKLERLKAVGLTLPILADGQPIGSSLLEATGGAGVDVIMDNVGKGALGDNIIGAAVLGRIVSVGRLGGVRDELDIDELARKRLKLIGVTFRTRTLAEHAAVVRRFEEDLLPDIAAGRLLPIVDKVFPLDQAEQAQQYMLQDGHFGKIVLDAA